MARAPVYFLAHGGPNLFENVTHPAYTKLQEIGKEITTKVKPSAVVVLSAHWQGDRKSVEVNTAESPDLIYDYYNFPPHYYKLEYPNKGSPKLAHRILDMLKADGIKAEGVSRGADHGVFIPFLVAFDPKSNPLKVPLVQVSIYDNEDASAHYALGKALAPLRDDGVAIIATGMVVHNTRDFRGFLQGLRSSEPLPYAKPFDDAVKAAAESDVRVREQEMAALLKRSDARAAAPTFEHLLPVHVAAGAASDDLGKQLWTMPEVSLSWAMYRFGEVAA